MPICLQINAIPDYAINKLIAEAFYLTKKIEKYGSGFIRSRKELETYHTRRLSLLWKRLAAVF